ncbi:MAG: hypothetical protein Q9217_005942 [Psora testacea]
MAYSYNVDTRITTGIILDSDEAEMIAIKDNILNHKASAGHELLLRTVITEISLKASGEGLLEVKQDVMDIEHSTGQHTWYNYDARDEKPKADVELSRAAHGLRIQIATVHRKIEVVLIWIELLQESLTKDGENSSDRESMLEWIQNINTQAKMAKLDAEWVAKRAENQVGAIYSLFAQRDNITAQKISEATNRDSSAMKSLAVLSAVFFPGTFIATLFSLDSLKEQPFWMYWVITAPLTFIVLGAWVSWTNWRMESVRRQELRLDRKGIA